MKIISWNINGYRSITGQNPSKRYDVISNDNKLFDYIKLSKPNIICLQETKANIDQIADEYLEPNGYIGYYNSAERKGYSGVATFIKEGFNVEHSSGIGIEKFDNEGRVIVSKCNDFILLNVYFPNGTKDEKRLKYKLDFYKHIFEFIEILRKKQPNILICGDYNTAHHPIDLANPKQHEKESGFLPIEREFLDYIESIGYVDAFRAFNKEPQQYSWWSNLGNARARNVGWRIDYFFGTNNLMQKIKKCYMEQEIMGSDHCPIIIEF
jgi:exodeoxyribonuclease-3